MAIVANEKNNVITISTRASSYQMKIDSCKHLIHTYYGDKIDDTDMSSQLFMMDRGFSGNTYSVGKVDRTYSMDVLPQEYSSYGTGDYRITGLKVREANGSRTCQLTVKDYRIVPGLQPIEGLPAVYDAEKNDSRESLCVTLEDEVNGLQVELWYGIIEEYDVITRSVKLINKGSSILNIEKAASMCLDIPFGEYDWITFYGRHAMERNASRRPVDHGISQIGSVRGTSSHHYNPFSILCEKGAGEKNGQCIGVSFMYSGEFLMEVEKDQADQTRLLCGIHPDNFTWVLEAGESLSLPQVIMTYSSSGYGELSRKLHRIIRNNVCRGEWKNKQRPVLINNWEATYFDFTGDKLVEIAREAQDMGIELFVMDDGWFGVRNDDNEGLGDWYPNEEKLGCTLKELGDRITANGMMFGIWFEPEAISEKSKLYEKHPEWAVASPGRLPELSRNQLILDFSRKDVREYIVESLSAVLESAPISYVKWDMNRSICDKFSGLLDSDHQGEFAHRYVLGLYEVLETLTSRFPHVLFEGCSGGGGRFDAGMLYYTPQIWCSDNTDAINRLNIQYGTSFGYPVSAVGAHVSAVPNHQTGRTTPFKTRGAVAMSGTFGYELDITKLSDEEKKAVSAQIDRFHQFYDVIQYGDYYRLTTDKDKCTVWEQVSENGSEALITGVYHGVEANPAPVHVKVEGLDAAAMYAVKLVDRLEEADASKLVEGSEETGNECVMSGIALKNAGLTMPAAKEDFDSFQIYITKI